MPLTMMDVIDSAVKIGLGAAISAFASYKTNKSNHLNEKDREVRAHKIKTIEMVAEKCERFINCYLNYRNRLAGILRKRSTDEEFLLSRSSIESLQEVDKDLFSALESANTARARLSLMRATAAQAELSRMISLLSRIRNPIMQEHLAPSRTAFDRFTHDMSDAINKFHEELARLYEGIT